MVSRIQLVVMTALTAVFATAGCAYHIGDVDRALPGGYRTIAVPVFKNKTNETGIEVYFTNAIIREFERGKIAKVTSKSDAQTTLEGVVETVEYVPSTQVESGTINKNSKLQLPSHTVLNTQYRILIKATLVLRRNSDQKVLWTGGFDGERTYLAPQITMVGLNSANATYNQSARYQNIEVMANDLMTEAHGRITENF